MDETNLHPCDVVGWETQAPGGVRCTPCGFEGVVEPASAIFGDDARLPELACAKCGRRLVLRFAEGLQSAFDDALTRLDELHAEAEAAAQQEEFDMEDRADAIARKLHDQFNHPHAPTNCPDCEALKGELEL